MNNSNRVHILQAVTVALMKLNPSALTSIHGIDLCFFTCYQPLYVVYLASSDGAHLTLRLPD